MVVRDEVGLAGGVCVLSYDPGDALLELFSWIGMNGYSQSGPVRELHLFGRENEHQDFNDVLIELQVPVN